MVELPLHASVTIFAFLARLFVGGVLLVAGLAKLKMPSNWFLQAVFGYDLVPKRVAVVLAYGLPWVEVMLGGLLLVGLWSRLVALISIGLLLIFSGGMTFNLLRGKRNECGCLQTLTPVQWKLIYRNLLLIALLLSVYTIYGVK